MKHIVFDIEADGLLDTLTKIHCISILDIDTRKVYSYHGSQMISQAIKIIKEADLLVAHNQIAYDLQAIRKLYNDFKIPTVDKICDTLILSRLSNPDRSGGHSLEAWSGLLRGDVRYKNLVPPKVQIADWNNLSVEDYIKRCEADVLINYAVYDYLQKPLHHSNYNLVNALECEQEIALIHTEQIQHGVAFNIVKARFAVHVINEERVNLHSKLIRYFKPTVISFSQKSTKPFTVKGTYTVHTKSWFGSDISLVKGEYCRVDFTDVREVFTKRQQLGKQLMNLGWKPKHFTETGIPKLIIDKEPCESLSKFGELGERLSYYFTICHRQSQIKGFIKNCWYDKDNVCRISADANTIGTPTFRYTHKIVANIPKASDKIIKGKLMRSLFTVPNYKNYRMVGSDASGLELRMLAHYISDENYTDIVVNGDIHSKHQEMAGLPTRDNAKSFIYAFLYGAGVMKLGSIVNGTSKQGTLMKQKFTKANPKLTKIISEVEDEASSGFLKGLDGRRICMRRINGMVQTHKSLNTLLQSAGAVVMKYADIWLYHKVKELGLNAVQVISYHDETQWEVHKNDVDKFITLSNQWVSKAGKLLGLNCPLASESKVGLNWKETH